MLVWFFFEHTDRLNDVETGTKDDWVKLEQKLGDLRAEVFGDINTIES